MSTVLEDRLVAALRTRADDVQLEDLRPATPPDPKQAPSRMLRATVYVGAAAATVAAIGLPIAAWLDGGDGGTQVSQGADPSKDIDGDGRPDEVSLVADGTLTVTLSGGGSLSHSFPKGTELIGTATIGTPGAGIVAAGPPHGQMDDRKITVLALGDADRLEQVATRGLPLEINESFTTWIADGTLYSGNWEDNGSLGVRVRTAPYAVDGGAGELIPGPVGDWCWDREKDPQPRACTSADEFTKPVGDGSGLPALFPESAADYLYPGEAWRADVDGDGQRDTIRLTGDITAGATEVAEGQLTLSVETAVGGWDMPLPAGSIPAVRRQVVAADFGQESGLLVVRGDGVGTTYSVYYSARIEPGPLPNSSKVPMFDGTPVGESNEYTTWVAADGTLFTRRAEGGDPVRNTVWRWRIVTGDQGPEVKPESLGTVCIDDSAYPPTYGTCKK